LCAQTFRQDLEKRLKLSRISAKLWHHLTIEFKITRTVSNSVSSSKNAKNPVKIDQQMAKLYFVKVPNIAAAQQDQNRPRPA